MNKDIFEFKYVSEEHGVEITHKLVQGDNTMAWSAAGGVFDQFFSFVKASGYVFNTDDYIGVYNYKEQKFRGTEEY